MSEQTQATYEPWQELAGIIDSDNPEHLAAFLQLLPPEETAYTIAQLSEQQQTRMLSQLATVQPELAANLIELFADDHAADMMEELPAEAAAAIFDEMDSDDQTDVLSELDDEDIEAILRQMDPQQADETRQRLQYDEDTAGGLMISEYLAYRKDQRVDEVISDMRANADKYQDYQVLYVYVVDSREHLVGVVTMRSLLFAPPDRRLMDIKLLDAITAPVDAELDTLEDLVDRHDYAAVPVVDADSRLVGVVMRTAIKTAISERSEENLAKFGGIIGGEELRSMSLNTRTVRRLAFLCPNIALFMISVSVIAFYEPVIADIPALAIFLPLIAGMSGACGYQSMAVSMRELTLGLLRPHDLRRVVAKELTMGAINGAVIGIVIGLLAWTMRPEAQRLGLVLAIAFTINCVFSVIVGGTLPLLFKRIKVDPAMLSGPVMTTFIDAGGFLLTLLLASAIML